MSDRRPSKLYIKTKCSACDHYGPHAYGSNPYYNHNGGGTEREATVDEVLVAVRRGVESGQIEGEVVETWETDDDEGRALGWFPRPDRYLVTPLSDGGSET